MTIGEILAGAVSVFFAMVVFMLQRQQRRRDEMADKQAEAAQGESRLMLRLIMANNKMSYATAIAVRDKKTNGEMEEAMRDHVATKQEYYDFINDYAITRIHGKK